MVSQLAVFVENRKGRVWELTKALKNEGVDLVTLSIADTKDFGILRCIARDNAKAQAALKEAGFTVTTTELLGFEVADKPGGLCDVLELFNENDINIEYLYSFAHVATKNAVVLFKVTDEELAIKLLEKNGIKLLDNSMI